MTSLEKIIDSYWEGAFLISLVGLETLKRNARVMFACDANSERTEYRLALTFELNDIWGTVYFEDGEIASLTPVALEELIGPIGVRDVAMASLAHDELEVDLLLAVFVLRQTDCTVKARRTDRGYEFEMTIGDKTWRVLDPKGEETGYYFRKRGKKKVPGKSLDLGGSNVVV